MHITSVTCSMVMSRIMIIDGARNIVADFFSSLRLCVRCPLRVPLSGSSLSSGSRRFRVSGTRKIRGAGSPVSRKDINIVGQGPVEAIVIEASAGERRLPTMLAP